MFKPEPVFFVGVVCPNCSLHAIVKIVYNPRTAEFPVLVCVCGQSIPTSIDIKVNPEYWKR